MKTNIPDPELVAVIPTQSFLKDVGARYPKAIKKHCADATKGRSEIGALESIKIIAAAISASFRPKGRMSSSATFNSPCGANCGTYTAANRRLP